jgi:hypothetical protein
MRLVAEVRMKLSVKRPPALVCKSSGYEACSPSLESAITFGLCMLLPHWMSSRSGGMTEGDITPEKDRQFGELLSKMSPNVSLNFYNLLLAYCH